jgi:predicted  nucleic acid-binding Zn-ribbon protein
MSTALHLFRLQQVDSRLSRVTQRLAEIQAQLENNPELLSARQQLADCQVKEREAGKALKLTENETLTQRIKLEQAEASLYSGRIQSPKELQDLQNDIAALKRQLTRLEDQELEAMQAAETAQIGLQAAQKKLDLVQGQVISANATLQSEQTTLKKEAETLNAQRQAILPAIQAADLTQYEALRLKRSGLAVSPVIDNSCDTCGAALTPGYAQSVRTSAQLVNCPMCGRILYSN